MTNLFLVWMQQCFLFLFMPGCKSSVMSDWFIWAQTDVKVLSCFIYKGPDKCWGSWKRKDLAPFFLLFGCSHYLTLSVLFINILYSLFCTSGDTPRTNSCLYSNSFTLQRCLCRSVHALNLLRHVRLQPLYSAALRSRTETNALFLSVVSFCNWAKRNAGFQGRYLRLLCPGVTTPPHGCQTHLSLYGLNCS